MVKALVVQTPRCESAASSHTKLCTSPSRASGGSFCRGTGAELQYTEFCLECSSGQEELDELNTTTPAEQGVLSTWVQSHVELSPQHALGQRCPELEPGSRVLPPPLRTQSPNTVRVGMMSMFLSGGYKVLPF